MQDMEFGPRLKELRQQAGLSQRELADKIGVNFSYISKIESGSMPPPSEKIIARLAEVLNADVDELIASAGRIPADIAQMLNKRDILELRMKRNRSSNMTGRVTAVRRLVNMKSLSRVAIPLVLVLAVATSLWYAGPTPVQAATLTVTNDATGTLGQTYSFTVTININSPDVLPVKSVDLSIYNTADPSTYTRSCTGLPIPNGPQATSTRTYTSATAGTVSVLATSGTGWGYAADQARYGYGYAYEVGWGTYSLGTNFGYGYGYGGQYDGATSLTYNITWTSPTAWPEGTYEMLILVNGNGKSFTTPTLPSFTLSAAAEEADDGDEYTISVVTLEPGSIDVSNIVTTQGEFTVDVVLESEDGNLTVTIPKGTKGLTAAGDPISTITVAEVVDPPDAPAGASIIGVVFDIDAGGATFDTPIEIAFTYDPDDIPAGLTAEDIVISYWDGTMWVDLPTSVGPDNTLIAEIDHLTKFAILARTIVEKPVVVVVAEEEEEVVEEVVVVEEEEEVVEEVVVVEEEEEEVVPVVVPEKAPMAWWIWLIIGIVVVAIIGGIVWQVMRRRAA